MREKTLYQEFDVNYINQEVKAILEGDIGYAYCVPQLAKIKNAVGKPTETFYGYYVNGEEVLKEQEDGKPQYYAIKMLDEDIELLAYKKERIAWFKDIHKKVPMSLKKKLMLQETIVSVDRVWNEIYDVLS